MRVSSIVTAAFGEQQRTYGGRGSGGRGGGRGRGGRGGSRGGGGQGRFGRGERQDRSSRDGGWEDRTPRDNDRWQDRSSTRTQQDGDRWEDRSARSQKGDGRWEDRSSARTQKDGDRWQDRSSARTQQDSDRWEDRRGGYDPRADNFFSDDDTGDFSGGNDSASWRPQRETRGGRGQRDFRERREPRGDFRERREPRGDFRERREPREYGEQRDRTTETPQQPSFKDLWIGDALYGVSPILAALEAGRRTVHTLYVQDSLMEGSGGAGRKDKAAFAAATARAKELGATVRPASKHDLNMVCDNRPHQGLVLDASELDFETLDAMAPAADVYDGTGPPPVWLCLDEVVDPQNFGAALRSAFFLGAAGVLTCRRNSAPLSPVVSKASAGAMELMPVHSCRSLPQTLADARAKGWTVVGAAAVPEAVPASAYRPTGPTLLVMGNEGYGLRTTVRQQCDAMLRIDGGAGKGGAAMGLGGAGVGAGERARRLAGLVDSLNVSVATGILMHQLLHPDTPAAE